MNNRLPWFIRLKNKLQGSLPPNTESFSQFLFKNTVNRKYLDMAGAAIIVQFIIFKICYPFADYFNDSYTYIYAATHHHAMSVRPIGYSRFLELVHLVTSSDTILIFIQYLLVQLGLVYLFFTIRYFYPLRKPVSNTLFVLLLFNPLSLYISNLIASDALFLGLFLTWFTLLFWILNRPRWIQLLPLAGLLFIMFTVRYTAIYFPALALLALLFCRRNWVFRITCLVVCALPIFFEVQRITHITKKETGTAVFSAFGGWVAANNALHMYPYINVKDSDFSSAESKALNKIVKHYFDTLPVAARPYPYAGVSFMWGHNTPLKTYMYLVQEKKKIDGYFRAWHAVAPVFSQYSTTLIKQHPVAFARYYLWPNTKAYCLPPLESFLAYMEGKNKPVDSVAVKWFRYKTDRLTCLNTTIQAKILAPIPWLFLFLNIVFAVMLATLLARSKRYALSPIFVRTILLAGSFWVINFCFNVYATPIVFRYQYMTMIVLITFSLVMYEKLFFSARHQPSPQ